jgi:hypothetical protein
MAEIEMVNDAFWLKYAADHVTNAVTSRDDAANKIDTYLAAIWTIYTGVLTAGIVFHQVSDNLWQIGMMALPVMILPIARYYCLRVLLPPLVQFYPNIPDNIEQVLYASVLTQKSKRLNVAKRWAFVSALSIATSLFFYKINEGTRKNYFVEQKYSAREKRFMVNGVCEPNKTFAVSLAGVADSATKAYTYYEGASETANADGSFSFVVPADTIKSDLKVILSWTDANSQLRTIRTK